MALGKRQNPFKAGSRSRLFFYRFRALKAGIDPLRSLAPPYPDGRYVGTAVIHPFESAGRLSAEVHIPDQRKQTPHGRYQLAAQLQTQPFATSPALPSSRS